MNSVRMSRQFEGSGVRVRRAMEKALRGEEIGIGILGASVTAGEFSFLPKVGNQRKFRLIVLSPFRLTFLVGHSILPGEQKWQERFYADLLTLFPKAKMHVGAVSATDSRFFAYCFEAVVPRDLDLYIVELDINNNPYVSNWLVDNKLRGKKLMLVSWELVIVVVWKLYEMTMR